MGRARRAGAPRSPSLRKNEEGPALYSEEAVRMLRPLVLFIFFFKITAAWLFSEGKLYILRPAELFGFPG